MGAIFSLTGYGRGEAHGSRTAILVEARSLNHRFLEIAIKLPRGLSAHEPDVRRLVQARAARGRFDIGVTARRVAAGPGALRVDRALGLAYVREARALAEASGIAPSLGVADLLRLPGVASLDEVEEDDAEGGQLLKTAVDEALGDLVRMRQTEGAALAADLDGHLQAIEAWVGEVGALLPAAVSRIQERLRDRVRALLGELPVDPGRLAQEVATWAAKSDVAEELARLASHVSQFRTLLRGGGTVGRQLDFLAQELHREVSTIGAKADDGTLIARVLEARTIVERLREQVQNVE
jgi:uncharacterized protein (TIGR00255 family)